VDVHTFLSHVPWSILVGNLLVVPVVRMVWNLRVNHISHMQESLARIEAKIDRHLEWHSEQK